jgi:uncharacterized protein
MNIILFVLPFYGVFMLISLRFKNFYSFAEETEIDFTVGKQPAASGFDMTLPSRRLNKVIAVVGANGAGKTQLIKPLAFLSWFVNSSFLGQESEQEIPYRPHALHAEEPTEFTLHFLLQGEEYRYQLVLQRLRVVSEILSVKTSSQFSYLFKREKSEQGFTFKEKGFPFPAKLAQGLRDNASILSAAYAYDIAQAKPFIDYVRGLVGNVVAMGRAPFRSAELFRVAESYQADDKLRARMVQALKAFDLGLSDIQIERVERLGNDGQPEVMYLPFGVHQNAEGGFSLPFFEESNGTQSAFVVLEKVLQVLVYGGMAVIDELDNDLHPHLIPKILDWFRFEHTNPHQAQLLFTCHTPEVLNRLQKHQVYLCEKQQHCSAAWRLDAVGGLRADDNLYAKYMAGALGAVPEV